MEPWECFFTNVSRYTSLNGYFLVYFYVLLAFEMLQMDRLFSLAIKILSLVSLLILFISRLILGQFYKIYNWFVSSQHWFCNTFTFSYSNLTLCPLFANLFIVLIFRNSLVGFWEGLGLYCDSLISLEFGECWLSFQFLRHLWRWCKICQCFSKLSCRIKPSHHRK